MGDVTSYGSEWRMGVVTSYGSGWRMGVVTSYGSGLRKDVVACYGNEGRKEECHKQLLEVCEQRCCIGCFSLSRQYNTTMLPSAKLGALI